jgi:hypothetical protein
MNSRSTKSEVFRLGISAERYRSYYAGVARNVIVTLPDGRKLQFPANILRAYLGHDGIYGLFRLSYDENHKLQGLERLGD